MTTYDLTQKMVPYLDRQLIFPLLQYLSGQHVRTDEWLRTKSLVALLYRAGIVKMLPPANSSMSALPHLDLQRKGSFESES